MAEIQVKYFVVGFVFNWRGMKTENLFYEWLHMNENRKSFDKNSMIKKLGQSIIFIILDGKTVFTFAGVDMPDHGCGMS